MRYPKIGEQVRVKNETGLHAVVAVEPGFRFSGVLIVGDVILDNQRRVSIDDIITKHQKWVTVYVIQQHYGRWEDVTQEEEYREAIARTREYRSNTNYATRLVVRKEPNPLYQE